MNLPEPGEFGRTMTVQPNDGNSEMDVRVLSSKESSEFRLSVIFPEVNLRDGKKLKPRSPVLLSVERHPRKKYYLDEDDDAGEFVYVLEDEGIDLHIVAERVEELEKFLEEEVEFLWKNYALENEKNLTVDAQKLKKRLLDRFEYHDS